MRFIRGGVLLLAAALALTAQAPPVVRPSPEYKIRFVDGTQVNLSSFRGKVVALLFVHTTCPHCQHASEVFNRLYNEYGARGFQPIDVAFNTMANLYVHDFVRDHNLSYPVGFGSPEDVLNYMGFSLMERYVVPQVVWIDRKGNIRSQTPPMGDEKMLTEAYWRNMIDTLTKETASSGPTPKTSVHRATSAKKSP
jgi:peroxiredoxin